MTIEERLESIEGKINKILSLHTETMPKMMSIDDVSKMTGLSKGYIYALTSKGKIPHYKPGPRIMYFDQSEIEAWMRVRTP